MRLGVLGPVVARTEQGELSVSGRRDRACLAALALHRGRAVPIDTFVDAVWPEDPPVSARKAIQNAVSRLRKKLGATVIELAPTGYRLGSTSNWMLTLWSGWSRIGPPVPSN